MEAITPSNEIVNEPARVQGWAQRHEHIDAGTTRLQTHGLARGDQPMDLKRFFERAVCVSLKSRPERWREFQRELRDAGIYPGSVDRFTAIDGRVCAPPAWWRAGAGAWGCFRSHVRILEDALQDGVDTLLIFEDDACFSPGFVERFSQFWATLPADWDGILLGGQHRRKPVPVSDGVLRVLDGHRTHAHALRGRYIKQAYRHLCDFAAHVQFPRQHVDHRFGVLHRSGACNVYAPSRWLVGQGAGISSICGQDLPMRYWNGPKVRESAADAGPEPFVAQEPPIVVLGTYRSGTSCVGGILQRLGVHMGIQMVPPNAFNPRGYFEPVWLGRHLQRMWDEPTLSVVPLPAERVTLLRRWMRDQRQYLDDEGIVVGVKHPLLCLMGRDIIEAWGPACRFISVHRDVEQSSASLDRCGWWKPSDRRRLLERLRAERDAFLKEQAHLRVDFDRLMAEPAKEVWRIVDYLGIRPIEVQVENAIQSVTRHTVA